MSSITQSFFLPLTGGTLTGDLIFTDATYDIGKSGATRPRDYYGSRIVSAGTQFNVGAIKLIDVSGEYAQFYAANGTSKRLTLGGSDATNYYDNTVHSFRSADTLTAFASISATGAQLLGGTAVPAGGTTGTGIKISSTSNLGVFFGSGVPTLSAAQGSFYIRTDGSSTSTRGYINTDGSTTWTAVTTAA